MVKELFSFSPSPSAPAPLSPILLQLKLYKSQIMKVMYFDSCLLELSQGLILLQSITKCYCSLISDFVVIQTVPVANKAECFMGSCLLEVSQGNILLQAIAKSDCSLISNFVVVQAVPVANKAEYFIGSCLLELSQGLILLQCITESHRNAVSNETAFKPESQEICMRIGFYCGD